MKIAVINETSAADKNKDIIAALDAFDHKIFNVGMKKLADIRNLPILIQVFLELFF